jgi:hypothetical protein
MPRVTARLFSLPLKRRPKFHYHRRTEVYIGGDAIVMQSSPSIFVEPGTVMKPAELKSVSEQYAAFAADEARGSSEAYEKLAVAVANSNDLLEFIVTLPVEKRQPNLFLAAVRHVCGVPRNVDDLRQFVRARQAQIREVMLSRTTQTNEPARCAVLLPLLAQLPQPLALLEVGASAGLCLLLDHYGYDYGNARIDPTISGDGNAPVFTCEVSGTVPLPKTIPRIAWRAGLDLNPIDVRSEDDAAWLETLVWPGQNERVARLHAAINIARRDPPKVVRGDLQTDLARLAATAPRDATLVVFHTAVLGYVLPPSARERFAATVREAGAEWISNEASGVFPSIAKRAPPSPARGRFLISWNGTPVAWAGPHGQSLYWFGTA